MRNKRLDILRCIAIFLVMFSHGGGDIWPALAHRGWVGVDLFFVLSGFLISGLLFNEFKSRGSISLKRFFVRRALKIYPAFYLFLFLTGIMTYFIFHHSAPLAHYLPEIFFVQNYLPGVWDHTWSLAIEEHFYILLPILLVWMANTAAGQSNPFRSLPWMFVGVAMLCICFRAATVYIGTPNYHIACVGSHNRMDSLFFGVLLGYLHHFQPQVLDSFIRTPINRVLVVLCSAALLSLTCFLPRDSRFFSTFGFSCLYLGFGGVLLLSLYTPAILRGRIGRYSAAIGTAMAAVGTYSYSIYLWHGPTAAWFPGFVRRVLHVSLGSFARFTVFVIGSLIIGVAMSKLVEYPILRIRDRIFPAPEGAVLPPLGVQHVEALRSPQTVVSVSPM